MKKRTLFALVILVISSIVIGRVLFGKPVDPVDSWDYAVLLASFGFLLSFRHLLIICYRNWFEIGPSISYYAAWFGIVTGFIVFAGSIVIMFLPETTKILSDWARSMIMLTSLFVVYCASSYLAP